MPTSEAKLLMSKLGSIKLLMFETYVLVGPSSVTSVAPSFISKV